MVQFAQAEAGSLKHCYTNGLLGEPVTRVPDWQDAESEVYLPGRWLGCRVGIYFLLAGAIAFVCIGGGVPPGIPLWIAKFATAVFALLGGAVAARCIADMISPVWVRHAAPAVLPDVPTEPVILEGSVVHGRLTHELVEESDGWQFRPARQNWRKDLILLLGFGIPLSILFSGILSWFFRSQLNVASWPVSILGGICATAVFVGSTFSLIGMIMRAGYRRLCWLSIPRNGDSLQLDSPQAPGPEKADLAEGLNWVFLGEAKRQRLTIPRELVAAVQLCPWELALSSERTWAVQGSLVLTRSADAGYSRQPVLLTGDFVGAARLMQRLAMALHVPYLFCADAEGWKAEMNRAKKRRPLRVGGSQ
jgi:hypothetical protein